MHIARLKQADVHWREDGNPQGQPIVFANSLGTDLRLWDQVVDRLPGDEYRFIRYDKRGHGLSSCPPRPYSISDLVDDTVELLEHLKVENCVFVGLSIGGMIGQLLAARHPEKVSKMVLACTAAKMGSELMWLDRMAKIEQEGMASITDGVLLRWFSEGFLKTDAVVGWRHMLERTPAKGYMGCCQALAAADLAASTSSLKLPVLGIAGSEDLASPPHQVRETIELIENGKFVEIGETGHLPCAERPDEFCQALLAFLKEDAHA